MASEQKSKRRWMFAFIAMSIIGVVVFARRKSVADSFKNMTSGNSVVQYLQGKVWDYTSENRINELHPMIQDKAREFINLAEQQGIKLRVTDTLRTPEEQEADYAQGRTTSGKIITNAHAWESLHNYGLALDVVEIVNGQPNWKGDWNKIAQIGKSLGFSWGGDWVGFVDKPHFEMTFGNSWADLKKLHDAGDETDGYVNIS